MTTVNVWTAAALRRAPFPNQCSRSVSVGRYTCATLLLQAGTPVHVVSERLGHSAVSMTMEVYAHVLPDMQTEAAATLGALLHAR